MSSSEVTNITFQVIKNITGEFSKEKKVGSGGYGEVYKGVLNGENIAVKKLFPVNGLDDEAFENEFGNLMKVKHVNIIRLISYCYEIAHQHIEHKGKLVLAQVIDRALCFEYMQGGSLAKHISDESCIYDWPTTYKIIKGTCEGLHYLHKGRGEADYVYHMDLKPENILLDKNMVPKIGDFGLSRLFGTSKTYQTSSNRGTIGFMPPEFINSGIVTPKNDVFSLGVVIFYIMAGQKGYNDYCGSRSLRPEFIERVQEYWKKKMHASPGCTWHEVDLIGVKLCIEIAMNCVETEREKRPTTMEIVDSLHELDAQIEKMTKKESKSLVGQNKLGYKDIVVDPSLELRFPFELKRDVSCCLQLTNKAVDSFIAFNVRTDRNKYRAEPSKGILPPCSKCYITLTLQAQDKEPRNMRCLDMFILQGTRVSEDFRFEEITEDFLTKATTVDEVTLPIVYVGIGPTSGAGDTLA